MNKATPNCHEPNHYQKKRYTGHKHRILHDPCRITRLPDKKKPNRYKNAINARIMGDLYHQWHSGGIMTRLETRLLERWGMLQSALLYDSKGILRRFYYDN